MTLTDAASAIGVLGVILAILVPQFRVDQQSSRAAGSSPAAIDETLVMLRERIELYRFRNDGRLPGDAETEADFLADLKLGTDGLATRPTGGELRTADLSGDSPAPVESAVPANPNNGSHRIHVSDEPPRDGACGWWYCPRTGALRATQ